MPTQAASCFSTEPPLAYVMPSKLNSTSSRSLIVATIGWVDGSWSCMAARVLSTEVNVAQASVNSVTDAAAIVLVQVAKDSFSQRSFHHFMVTRLPNHMWESSCRITTVR